MAISIRLKLKAVFNLYLISSNSHFLSPHKKKLLNLWTLEKNAADYAHAL